MISGHHRGVEGRPGVEELAAVEHDAGPSSSRARRKHRTSGGKGKGRRGGARAIRVRFSDDVIELVDQLADELKGELRRSISRSALMRALVATSVKAGESRKAIVDYLTEDPVRHGRAPGEGRAGVRSRKQKARRA